jgi:hypothetical protein
MTSENAMAEAIRGKYIHWLVPAPGRTRGEFQQWWLHGHSAVIRRHAEARGMRRYVQNHAALDGRPGPYVGFTMSSWDSIEARRASERTPEGAAGNRAAQEDSAPWVDRAESGMAITDEHVIFGGQAEALDGAPTLGFKLVICIRRLPEVPREEFRSWLLERHAPLVREHAEARATQRYTLSVTLADWAERQVDLGRGEPYDAFAELWWASAEARAAAAESSAGRAAAELLAASERPYLARGVLVPVTEYVFVDRPRK